MCSLAMHKGAVYLHVCMSFVQVLSKAVPVDPDAVEALVNSPLEQPLWARAGSSSESESEPLETGAAVSAAEA